MTAQPTLLTAYGGFQISETARYSATVGKLCWSAGGVYVLANIRGGGEFGPAWHEAGLKTHRQRIYDDFAAVGKDLITRRITSPRRLGIQGGSNGGLLMGVEMTQHPDMWNAILIEIPLLDMLGFEHIAAGASWVGRIWFGGGPDQRAFLASISPYNQLRKGVKYPSVHFYDHEGRSGSGRSTRASLRRKWRNSTSRFYYDEIVEGGSRCGCRSEGTGEDSRGGVYVPDAKADGLISGPQGRESQRESFCLVSRGGRLGRSRTRKLIPASCGSHRMFSLRCWPSPV